MKETDDALFDETLHSERLRAGVISILLAAVLVTVVFVYGFFHEAFERFTT